MYWASPEGALTSEVETSAAIYAVLGIGGGALIGAVLAIASQREHGQS